MSENSPRRVSKEGYSQISKTNSIFFILKIRTTRDLLTNMRRLPQVWFILAETQFIPIDKKTMVRFCIQRRELKCVVDWECQNP